MHFCKRLINTFKDSRFYLSKDLLVTVQTHERIKILTHFSINKVWITPELGFNSRQSTYLFAENAAIHLCIWVQNH